MIVERDQAWAAVADGVDMLGGEMVRKGLEEAWRLAMHDDPPLDPSSRDVPWREAILWTVASAVVIGLASLIARRGAAAGWERLTGEAPPF